MPHRHPAPIPRLWLMTDERMGDALWAALDRLPRGAGVVFRHHSLAPGARRRLLGQVIAVARRRRLLVLAAGFDGPGGSHNRRPRRGLHSRSAHDRREAVAAVRAGAELVFVSPVFATRSHPGARALGRWRFAAVARGLGVPVIALGGMDARRGRRVAALGAYGWAAIDAWTGSDRLSPPAGVTQYVRI